MKYNVAKVVLVFIAFIVISLDVSAKDGIVEMLERVNKVPEEGSKTVVAFGLFIGLVFMASTAFQLKQLGMAGAGNFGSAKNPLYSFAAAVFLIFMTTFVGIGGITLFGDSATDVGTTGNTTIRY